MKLKDILSLALDLAYYAQEKQGDDADNSQDILRLMECLESEDTSYKQIALDALKNEGYAVGALWSAEDVCMQAERTGKILKSDVNCQEVIEEVVSSERITTDTNEAICDTILAEDLGVEPAVGMKVLVSPMDLNDDLFENEFQGRIIEVFDDCLRVEDGDMEVFDVTYTQVRAL